nr:uncharacterized protein LOC127341339 [Lolium perenne]
MVVAVSLLPCTSSTGHRRLPPPPLLPSSAPSSQKKEDAPRSSHHGGATGLLVDAACVDSAARAAPSITPVCVVHANDGVRRGAARSRGGAGDREVELLVRETQPYRVLSASASKVSPWPARAAWSASRTSSSLQCQFPVRFDLVWFGSVDVWIMS